MTCSCNMPAEDGLEKPSREVHIHMPGPEEAKVFVHKTCVLHSTILAVSAMQNAIPLIHGPVSCTYHYKVFLEMFLGHKSRIVCSGLTESDVIFGAAEKLRQAIIETYERFRPELIGVLTTCAADLSGEDVKGVVDEVRKELTGCEVIYVASGGFRGGSAGPNQGYGYHMVYNALVPLMEEPKMKVRRSVNILGHVHPPGTNQDIDEIVRPLKRMGVKINCVLTSGARLSDIRRVPEAELNVLRCENNARRTAEILKEKFGLPYTNLGMSPVGVKTNSEWLMEVARALDMEGEARRVIQWEEDHARRKIQPIREAVQGKRAAVFLSPGKSIAVSKFLYEDLGIQPKVICLLHYNEWAIDTMKRFASGLDLDPVIMVEPEYTEVISALEEHGIELALGGTTEKQICKRLGIPYVHEMVYEEPHQGYLGAVKLAQEIYDVLKAG